tara:strand:+ start:710 stop:1192 length:483 start_codon:yes stop_codon:yes gene_type:complete
MSNKKNILDHIKPAKIKVPDEDFFTSLATKVTDTYPKVKATKKKGHTRFLYFGYAAAAILVIGFILFQQFNTPTPQVKTAESYLAEVSTSQILEYIDTHIENYSDDEIIEIASIILTEDNEFMGDGSFLPSDIEQADIEQYINEEYINLNEFEEDELLIF